MLSPVDVCPSEWAFGADFAAAPSSCILVRKQRSLFETNRGSVSSAGIPSCLLPTPVLNVTFDAQRSRCVMLAVQSVGFIQGSLESMHLRNADRVLTWLAVTVAWEVAFQTWNILLISLILPSVIHFSSATDFFCVSDSETDDKVKLPYYFKSSRFCFLAQKITEPRIHCINTQKMAKLQNHVKNNMKK